MAKVVSAIDAPLPFFSIIIPTYNRTQDLLQTLSALEKQSYQSFEVVVCSAGSKDTFQKLKSYKSSFPINNLYIESPGRTLQRNHACQNARGSYFVFLDDHFIAHPNLLKNYSGLIHTCPDPVHFIRGGVLFIKKPTSLKDSQIEECVQYRWHHLQDPFQMSVTNNLCVSRYAFEGVGGFDEDFKFYGFEDAELGCRIKAAGFKFHYLRKSFGAVFMSSTAYDPESYQKFIETGRSAYLLYLKSKKYGRKAGYHIINLLIAKRLQHSGKLENRLARIIKTNRVLSSDHFYLFLMGILEGPQYFKKEHYKAWKKQILGPSI